MSPYDLLCNLAACLCAELTPDGAPEPDLCFCGLVPGQVFAHDYAWECDSKCGAAWVRLVTAYPAEGVGVPAENRLGCGTLLGMDIEVGVIRCITQEPDGNPPTVEELETAAANQFADMIASRKAIKCCEGLQQYDHSLSVYQPLGPQGMVTGGAWVVSVAM